MLARQKRRTIRDYVSDRVFDGTRPISAARLAKLKAGYYRTQSRHYRTQMTMLYRTMMVHPLARLSRLLGFKTAGC